MPRRKTQALEIKIPTMDWQQIGGDMNPSQYGGTIATADGRSIELIKIQPVREYVGDKEAKDVGFPFWTRTAYFDLDDLSLERDEVQSALESAGPSEEDLEKFTPEQRALAIAEALLDYGNGDEGPAGWSGDIGIPEAVKWWDNKVHGSEYIADEDDEFIREVLLGDLDIDYYQEGTGHDPKTATSALKVETRGFTVEITEWQDIEDANGEEQPEGEKIVKQSTEVELDELFDPKGKHRGTYSGDDKGISLEDLAKMDSDEDREKAIIAAAIAYMGYYGGSEEFVDRVGD